MAHLWEPCLPPKCKAKLLLFSSLETSWPGPSVNGWREEEINISPPLYEGRVLARTRTLHPPLLVKSRLNSNLGKIVLWDISPPSSWSAGFLRVSCSNNLSLNSLPCYVASSMSSISVTVPLHTQQNGWYFKTWQHEILERIRSSLCVYNDIITLENIKYTYSLVYGKT